MNNNTDLQAWLGQHMPALDEVEVVPPTTLKPNTWQEIRLFLSSTFIDTQEERNLIITRIVPNINHRLKNKFIRIVPVDLRWGVLPEESKDFENIQKICLNQIEECRHDPRLSPWLIGLRTTRYGWVQERVLKSEHFNCPENFAWIDDFSEHGCPVSITSLECLHATRRPLMRTNYTNMMFYQRHIDNIGEIPAVQRKKYDFDHKEHHHKENLNTLNKYLRSLKHVLYRDYHCSSRDDKLTDLDKFEKQVEEDLLQAVFQNFILPRSDNLPSLVLETMEHENSVAARSETFIGRDTEVDQCVHFCEDRDVQSNIMIVHGKPGAGKSGLLAKVASDVLAKSKNTLGTPVHFVHVHNVGVSAHSNELEILLVRLQLRIRHFRRDILSESIETDAPESVADLKATHHEFLQDTALKHPKTTFTIIIDAINQLSNAMSAHQMWWLPNRDQPNNLRFLISTLDDENHTYENACTVRNDAQILHLLELSMTDRKLMVRGILAKYNKKLSESEDPKLGNQMEKLIRKNGSPLYLYSAVEALRTRGIYEEINNYIADMPKDINGLFKMLIEEWSAAHGRDFIRDVCSLLFVSRLGLMEMQLIEILLFIEQRKNVQYTSSFSRLYDSLRPFLAAGGSGRLRFFHTQLEVALSEVLMSAKDTSEIKIHHTIIEYYFQCIQNQLLSSPSLPCAVYYDYCLDELVYHQLTAAIKINFRRGMAIMNNDKSLVQKVESIQSEIMFSFTLRNIYFVRERIIHNQLRSLLAEYSQAIALSTDKTKTAELKCWRRFVAFYGIHIKNFPEWCHHFAVNQSPNSIVLKNTMALPISPPVYDQGFPLLWCNKPTDATDNESIKFITDQCWSCAVTSSDKNTCCVGGTKKAYLCDLETADIIHQVKVKGLVTAVHLSSCDNTFVTGENNGEVTVWNASSGVKGWRMNVNDPVCWLGEIGGQMACATGFKFDRSHTIIGKVHVVDPLTHTVTNEWSTGDPMFFLLLLRQV